ncbi:MAG: histidinol-phosphate transaminase [Halanaerobiaceae bacterium]
MSIYWSKLTKKVVPYVPGEQPKDKKYVKLNTNENPYPPSPRVIRAIRQAANENLKLYPDPTCEELKVTIADYYNVEQNQVFIGNGSDEVLAFSFMAFFDSDIIFPVITYSFYPVYANLFNINYRTVPLNEDFSIPVEELSTVNGGVIFPNPNAPTGKYLSLEKIKEILDRNTEQVVIIDEAYIDFGGESAVGLIDKYPNLLVVQTLSKSRALAGLRIGYAFGQQHLIEGLDRIKNSFNSYTLDRIALAGAKEAIKDEEYFLKIRTKVINTREQVSEELRRIGFKVVDSKTNFLFISHPEVQAEDLFYQLKQKGILVRYFNKSGIDNYLRVSIGKDKDMDLFLQTLKVILC